MAMCLIAIVPVVASLIIFDRISDFNQNLQKQAVESIDGVSDVYRDMVRAEASKIDLLQKNLALEVDRILEKHQITRVREVRQSEEFKQDLMRLFQSYVDTEELIVDIRLVINMLPVVKAGARPTEPDKYTIQPYKIPVALRSRYQAAQSTLVNDWDEMPVLVAEPVDDNETMDLKDVPGLPDDISGLMGKAPVSSSGVQLLVFFANDRAKSERYKQLGENRLLHGAITALETTDDSKMTSIYRLIFYSVAALVFILAIVCAFLIAFPLSRRVSELSRATERIADGDLSAKVEVRGNDQIAFLMAQFNDMVEQVRSAQESKAYIERMQAWQEVARRLAHEIKNPLTPIVLAVQQLDGKFDDYIEKPQKYRKLLTNAVEIVNEETETLRKLVKNFSEFARMPIPEKQATKFSQFVSQTIEQNPQFAEQAQRITVHPADSSMSELEIEIDHELMRRVIVNIVRNGIEAATNAHFSPEIDIYTVDPGEKELRYSVILRIIDNGPGLTEEQKNKLFMPYFTTKSDGTGLGLAIVRKIVEDHNGKIQLHDRDDGERGTQADIYL